MVRSRNDELRPFLKVIDAVLKQWWFLLRFALLQLIPPYTSQGYRFYKWGEVNAFILTHSIKSNFTDIYPVFQIIPLVLLIALFLVGARIIRVLCVYASVSYVLIAILQNVSISDQYGLAVCTANVFTFLILAGLWFWEGVFPQAKIDTKVKPNWKYWVILLALIPFWEPINSNTLAPDFNLAYLLTSGAGLSFCMVTPLFLAILLQFYPNINKTVFVATSFVGVLMGLGNMVLEFVLVPSYWWIGMLHVPLFTISLYCLYLS